MLELQQNQKEGKKNIKEIIQAGVAKEGSVFSKADRREGSSSMLGKTIPTVEK